MNNFLELVQPILEIENITLEEYTMRLLRLERKRLLQETDWIATIDYPGSSQVQNLWLDYRQALRDLPATAEPQLDEFGNLINVEWPTPPENS